MNSLRVPRLARITKFLTTTSSNFGAHPAKNELNGEKEPYWHKLKSDKIVREFDEIPGPKFLPIIGHEWRYYIGMYNRDAIHHSFRKLFDEYGYVVKEHIGRKRVIVHLFHEEDIDKVYENDGQYPSRMSNRIMEQYRRERPHQYACAGLGPSNGDEWYTFRSQFNKAQGIFLKQNHDEDLEKLANDLVIKVASGLDKQGELDIMPDFYRWTLEGVGVVTLSRRLGCLDAEPEADRLIEAAHTTNDVIFRTEMSAHGWRKQYRRLVPAQDYFSDVVRQYIDKAIAEDSNNLLKTILTPEVNLKDVHTFVLDLFQAGIHTTAVSAAFALYHLARNPSVQDRLRAELMRVLPTKDARFTQVNPKTLRVTQNVLKEALRLNPPTIGNGRILQVPLVLGGYNIPQGTMVLLHHMVASRLEENFSSAHLFRPERWSESSSSPDFDPALQRRRSLFACMPFGHGKRGCIGRSLALAQMSLAVVKFIRNYEISYHYEDIDTVNRLHNEPDKPMKLRFKPLNDGGH